MLPLVLGLLLFLVQLGLVIRAQILVINAAREGARAAAVEPADAVARQAAEGAGSLDPARMAVALVNNGRTVTVTVTYRTATDVPIVGALLDDITLTESTTMHLEPR